MIAPSHAAPRLKACPNCGLLQSAPPPAARMSMSCSRCGSVLSRSTAHSLDESLALYMAALSLLVITASTTMMSVSAAGMQHSAYLLSGPAELLRRDMTSLAIVVVFVTLIAPMLRLTGVIATLLSIRGGAPAPVMGRVFALTERLKPWSMVEVFVFGVFVAYVKLGDLVRITLDPGVYALLALTFVLIWADSSLDSTMVWDRLQPAPDRARDPCFPTVACERCGLLSAPVHRHAHCPRCASVLHPRKPDSVQRTWALLIASTVLYVPANIYPVLTVMQLGSGAPATILGGVEELIGSRMYPLAALVFFASIAVPMLKIVGLTVMLISVQAGWTTRLRGRTRLYGLIRGLGRWSMIDIFMESLLGALVRFGTVVTIEPGMGAIAFCGVVILTMWAAETFDPRLMWDAANPGLAPPACSRTLGQAAKPNAI